MRTKIHSALQHFANINFGSQKIQSIIASTPQHQSKKQREEKFSPLPAHDDLLAPGELELGAPKRLLCVHTIVIPTPHRQQHLANVDTCADALRLSESTTHACLQTIRARAREHLVDAQHVERVHTHTQVESVLTRVLGHVLVARNTRSLQGLARHILLLPRHQMHTEWELVHALLLHAHVIDTDLGVRHTPAEA